ncbi:ethanolamine utilization microcompartment protein EutL, partial [Klebsiella quasipneumoniae]
YGRSLYAGAAHGPSPTAGEVLIMLGGPNPAEVRAGLDAMMAHIEGGAAFQWANDAQDTAFLAHVVSRTGSYLSSAAGIALGDPIAYLVAPPLEATFGIDAAMKSADVQLVTYVPPPSETNYSAAFLTGSQAACKAACNAFTDAVLDIARHPV